MQEAITSCQSYAYICIHAHAHVQEAVTACCGNASEVEGMHGIVSEVLHSVEEWAPVYENSSFSEFLDFSMFMYITLSRSERQCMKFHPFEKFWIFCIFYILLSVEEWATVY